MSLVLQNSVLIIDDVPTNIKVLFELLEQSGFIVSVAKSGESALKKVKETLPDLILLDVMMPGIDGFETCRRLKADKNTENIPVIFMTALSDVVDKVKGLSIGAVDYITKPFQHEEVLARIDVHLKLRKAQLRLAEEEKFSALGELVAGISDEINNPINFISGNLPHAQNYYQDLIELVDLYGKEFPQSSPKIQKLIQEIDLEHIKQDLPKLITSMKIGATKVTEIVDALRIFLRLDEAELKLVDIHEGIDSTLMLLSYRLQANQENSGIKVIKEYNQLPLIECYAGQLNQVFMNLLSNAVDTLDEKAGSNTNIDTLSFIPTIRISTEISPEKSAVFISITDNGCGIGDEVKPRIFDQFFTTKPVGKGIGLGLSVSRQIVENQHGGKLSFVSQMGEGTKFTIEIPNTQVFWENQRSTANIR